MITEEVKLVNLDGVEVVLDLLEELPNDTQTAIDILFVALVACEAVGIEGESVYEIIPQQYKQAKKLVDSMFDGESN